MQVIGIQEEGSSPAFTKRMALEAYAIARQRRPLTRLADLGCGRGELSLQLSELSPDLVMMDSYRPPTLPPGASFVQADLNGDWPIESASVDMAFAVEVIEHVENPRHFLREFARILKPGGFGYVSTPNNHSWLSKLTFLLKGEHRFFQDLSYPGHITPLLECDCLRMLAECNLRLVRFLYSDEDSLPLVHWRSRLPGKHFSMTWGWLFEKPEVTSGGSNAGR